MNLMLNAALSAWLRASTSPRIQDITLNLSLNMKCSKRDMHTVVKHYLLISCIPMFPVTMKCELFVSKSLAF